MADLFTFVVATGKWLVAGFLASPHGIITWSLLFLSTAPTGLHTSVAADGTCIWMTNVLTLVRFASEQFLTFLFTRPLGCTTTHSLLFLLTETHSINCLWAGRTRTGVTQQ